MLINNIQGVRPEIRKVESNAPRSYLKISAIVVGSFAAVGISGLALRFGMPSIRYLAQQKVNELIVGAAPAIGAVIATLDPEMRIKVMQFLARVATIREKAFPEQEIKREEFTVESEPFSSKLGSHLLQDSKTNVPDYPFTDLSKLKTPVATPATGESAARTAAPVPEPAQVAKKENPKEEPFYEKWGLSWFTGSQAASPEPSPADLSKPNTPVTAPAAEEPVVETSAPVSVAVVEPARVTSTSVPIVEAPTEEALIPASVKLEVPVLPQPEQPTIIFVPAGEGGLIEVPSLDPALTKPLWQIRVQQALEKTQGLAARLGEKLQEGVNNTPIDVDRNPFR